MSAHFNNDENVQKVVINANGNFAIKEIKGPNIEEIELSGKMLTISTLCPFLRTQKDLPKLRKVSLTNIGIKNFKANQDCGNDSLTTHLQKPIPMKVEVCYIAFQRAYGLPRAYYSSLLAFDLSSLWPFQPLASPSLRPLPAFGLQPWIYFILNIFSDFDTKCHHQCDKFTR